jgi:hypothetical protein
MGIICYQQEPELHLQVSTPQGPEIPLDRLHYRSLSCSWTCQHHRGVSCTWTYLHYTGIGFTYMYLHYRATAGAANRTCPSISFHHITKSITNPFPPAKMDKTPIRIRSPAFVLCGHITGWGGGGERGARSRISHTTCPLPPQLAYQIRHPASLS